MSTPLRVLIVEDSEDDTQLMLRELRRGGYDPVFERVETADQMQAALKKRDWELILCDHALPAFSAPKALELLKRTALDIPFIEVSGKIGEETAVEMMRTGAHDYVMKDNLTRLPAAIKRELAEADVRRAHKRAEEEKENLAKFPAENPDPVLRVAKNGTVIFANKAARPLLDAWSCRLDQALPKQWAELVASVLVSGAREDVEIKSDGRIFLVTFAPVVEAGYVNLYAHDITERKRAEEKIKKSQRLLAAVIEAIPDATMVIAADYRIVLANRAARDMAGMVDPAAADLRCHQVFHHRDVPCDGVGHPCPLVQVVATKGPVVVAHTRSDAEGNEVLMEVAAAPIFNEAGGLVQIVQFCRDITERVEE